MNVGNGSSKKEGCNRLARSPPTPRTLSKKSAAAGAAAGCDGRSIVVVIVRTGCCPAEHLHCCCCCSPPRCGAIRKSTDRVGRNGAAGCAAGSAPRPTRPRRTPRPRPRPGTRPGSTSLLPDRRQWRGGGRTDPRTIATSPAPARTPRPGNSTTVCGRRSGRPRGTWNRC